MSAPSSEARAVQEAATRLGSRLAVAGGAAVALVALLNHSPVWLACLYGAATVLAIRVTAHIGRNVLTKAMELDRRAQEAREPTKS